MSFRFRFLTVLFATAAVLGPVAAGAQAAPDIPAEVAQIRRLSETSPRKALDRLVAVRRMVGPDASYETLRTLLRQEIWLQDDLGRREASHAAERTLLRLAEAHGDAATAAFARLGEVRAKIDALGKALCTASINSASS